MFSLFFIRFLFVSSSFFIFTIISLFYFKKF